MFNLLNILDTLLLDFNIVLEQLRLLYGLEQQEQVDIKLLQEEQMLTSLFLLIMEQLGHYY